MTGRPAATEATVKLGAFDGSAARPLFTIRESAALGRGNRSVNLEYANGYIVYFRDEALMAQPFDAQALALSGEPLTLLDESRAETSHWWPVALPDGVHFLYLVRSLDDERRGIYLGRADQPAAHAGERLFYAESSVAYLPIAGSDEAELVYMANGRVESRRFNARTRARPVS